MTTQEYLEQYQAARRNVEYWQGRVEEAKARAEKTTAGIGGMPSAPNPQKLEQAVDAMQDAKRRTLPLSILIKTSPGMQMRCRYRSSCALNFAVT